MKKKKEKILTAKEISMATFVAVQILSKRLTGEPISFSLFDKKNNFIGYFDDQTPCNAQKIIQKKEERLLK